MHPTRPPRSPVSSITHKDTRVNIPTEELRDFVAEDEAAPQTMLYPRDPSLDPQLVWMGKDAQDAADLAVPVVPLYIQEKIHPQALIDDLLAEARRAAGIAEPPGAYQLNLFADFNGLPEAFDQRVNFYQHEGHWQNRMILGDSLLVMASLAEKEGLKGQVQCLYFDPPYGIKFGSNWQVSTRKRDVRDGKAEDATRQPEQVRAFRDTWRLGIHSYLAYLRDRFTVARDLLTETGSIFVQIGDENVHLVRCVLDEVFGSENFVSLVVYKKTSGATGNFLAGTHDFVLWYAKDTIQAKYRHLYVETPVAEAATQGYREVRIGSDVELVSYGDLSSQRQGRPSGPGTAMYFPVNVEGKDYFPYGDRGWTTTRVGMHRLVAANRIHSQQTRLRYVRLFRDFPYEQVTDYWDAPGVSDRIYVVQTNTRVIERCIHMTTDPGDLVLDPTYGSGTTAYVAEQWGRRWITVDTSRVALALARTRLMAARYPYYLLADSPEGRRRESELTGPPFSGGATTGDIRQGFVYRRVPHVTLKSIANNPDIHEGMTRAEIDAAIARHADSETLYDQPYEDNKTVRVSGPFTVESLSPHRVLATNGEDSAPALPREEVQREHDFARMILDNLRA
ncbi:MAG: site-specific DNA-methyltransferase, partial [Anaerolineae bacterium]